MRMKNRFCRIGNSLFFAVCLLSTCGITYSCSDDYDLDETKPSFLGESIYDELANRQDRKFTTVIRLIDDLGYKDVMSKTGSKTLFVADDDAYKTFFETTTWTDGTGQPVRSYDQLSTSQKRLLLNGSMLNNAYVLEMLTTLQGPVKNLCLRRLSNSAATDSIPYFKWNELPDNLNVGQVDENGKVSNEDSRFWDQYRNQAYGGMYLALDKTEPLLTHFLQSQLNEKKITHSDISFILNLDGTENEWSDDETRNGYVYDALIEEADVTCLNGYYHVLDRVLVTPSNMAEVIRTNGETNLFSAMLDRFSAPYFDQTLTDEYKSLHTITADSVFQKIYISQRSSLGSVTTDPDGSTLGDFPSLSYDPGWNAYATSSTITKEQDMAAMFVPTDAAMEEYFLPGGGGAMLIDRYSDRANTRENLEYNLFQIPLNVIKPLIANLMKESFNESVPSKYLTIMNDAQDQMFSAQTYPSVQDYKSLFKKVLLANNGVVYLMNSVISPATYASVMAPALYNKDGQVMNTIIHADDSYTGDNYSSAPLRKFYSTYLLAMQSNFTLFIPNDDGLKTYGMVDPVAYAKRNNWFWTLEPEDVTVKTTSGKYVAIRGRAYQYDIQKPFQFVEGTTAKLSANANTSLSSNDGKRKMQILTDLVDQNLIVHETSDEGELGMLSGHRYYLSRSGAPVYIKQKATASDGTNLVVEGGLQLLFDNDAYEGNEFDCKVTKGYDMMRKSSNSNYGNGFAYFLDRPVQPTLYNVWDVFNNTEDYKDFFKLCTDLSSNTALISDLFRTDDMDEDDWSTQMKKYLIFAQASDRVTRTGSQLVRFFNNYRYTIFVPSNEAVQKALDAGLPTLTEIQEFVDDPTNHENGDVDQPLLESAKAKGQAMLTCYVNFLKYHFCDQSLFVDEGYGSTGTTTRSSSACLDDNNNYITVNITQTDNAMTVVDQANITHTITSNDADINQMARDYELDGTVSASNSISSSSYVAMHKLNDYMLFDSKLKNGFAAAWESESTAKAFVKKFRIRK